MGKCNYHSVVTIELVSGLYVCPKTVMNSLILGRPSAGAHAVVVTM
jgi:hypothetical protein